MSNELVPIYTDAERKVLEDTPRTVEIDGRELSGGGTIRALYNKRTKDVYAELTDMGLHAEWLIDPSKVREVLEHPWGSLPLHITPTRLEVEDAS